MADLPMAGPGKFEGGYRLNELAHLASLAGWTSDEAGDVSTVGRWLGIIHAAMDSPESLATMANMAGDAGLAPLTSEETSFLASHEACIIEEDSQGFVSVEWYPRAEQAMATWERLSAIVADDDAWPGDEAE